jgi:ADP-ribosylglycohydrolase
MSADAGSVIIIPVLQHPIVPHQVKIMSTDKPTPTEVNLRSRFRGCLLGGAIGDALGAPVEFSTIESIRAQYGPEGITDFDVAYGRRGAITDDTQMTLFTAEGLMRADARYRSRGICKVAGVVHQAYLRWLQTQGESSQHPRVQSEGPDGWLIGIPELHSRRAPGLTCLAALRGSEKGSMTEPLNDSKGCGGVMRMAPVGLFVVRDRALELGCEFAALTHGHPSGYLASGALAMLIAELREGATLDKALDVVEDVLENHETAEPGGVAGRPQDETLHALRAARSLAAKGEPTAEKLESLGEGWVAEEALAMSVYCALVHPDDFAAAVCLAVNHSGDSDSTGAITGNIVGFMLGEEAIPGAWRRDVELAALILELADDLFATSRGEKLPWSKYPGW